MSEFLRYDSQNMWSETANVHGATKNAYKGLSGALEDATKALDALRVSEEQGFFHLPFDTKSADLIERHAKDVKSRFERLIVIGIGGSDLGARTLIESLQDEKRTGVHVIFLGNPDPDELHRALADTDMQKTAVNVVSKSGTTLETMSVFTYVREQLIEAVGREQHAEHVYVTTDPDRGILYDIAQEHGYTILPHPLNVGGRFAVMSVVGLFPAACAGIDVRRVQAGARSIEETHRSTGSDHFVAEFAALHYLGYKNRGQDIHVLMPYASRLNAVGSWFRQLWAESLGKRKNDDRVGPTPVSALGTVDQHSQIQLYNEGPNNKIVTFVEVESFDHDTLHVPDGFSNIDELAYMSGKSFEAIMHAERAGTAEALTENGRPNGTLYIPNISPESVGALLHFYELAVAYTGELLQVNAYNQPGVEKGKIRAKEILKNT